MSIWAPTERWLTMALPQDCLLCGKTATEHLLCTACVAGLPRLPEACCPVCAQPAPDALVCGACLKQTPFFDETRAVWPYEFPVAEMIHALKYAHRLATVDFFSRAMAALPCATPPDLIVPVPLAANRLKERGFNQAVEIARPLSRQLGVPMALNDIHRCRDAAPQATLPWKQRAGNIRHAFECRVDLSGLRILVVDDVMTTGATLNELARVLKAHGAAWVGNRVLARALRDGSSL